MKAIFKGNKFAIQWTIKDAVTSLPFDFTGMFVEYILYSDSYKGRIVGATTNINKMQAEIPANILPVGVYNIICKYRNSINEGHCIYRNAFQITRNPEFIGCDNVVVIESFSPPLKLENMDINYLGHFTSSDLLIDCNKPSWALVGKLNEAEPWFFYTEDAIPAGSQYGWNNMSEILGTYNLTEDKVSIYDFNLITEYNVSRNHTHTERKFSPHWGATTKYYPEYEEYSPCKIYEKDERVNMPGYTENSFIALHQTSDAPYEIVNETSEFSFSEAINLVPEEFRFPGIRMTYVKKDTHQAETWFYKGGSWENKNSWVKPDGNVTINNLPDEEDIASIGDNAPVLKLKDKVYNPQTFSGLGRTYLRKNMVNSKNVLTQAMFTNDDGSVRSNTRYIIQYDYDLNGATITIPDGCVLDFQGGSLRNGKVISNLIHSSWFVNNNDFWQSASLLREGGIAIIDCNLVISTTASLKKNVHLVGKENPKVILKVTDALNLNSGCIVDGITFDTDGSVFSTYLRVIRFGSYQSSILYSDIIVRNCYFLNMRSKKECNIITIGSIVRNATIENCIFENYGSDNETSEMTSDRISRGISAVGDIVGLVIKNNTFKNQYNFSGYDADAICVDHNSYSDVYDVAESELIVSNNKFYNIQTSPIKVFGSKSVIDSNQHFITDVENKSRMGYTGICRVYRCHNVIISNNNLIAKHAIGVIGLQHVDNVTIVNNSAIIEENPVDAFQLILLNSCKTVYIDGATIVAKNLNSSNEACSIFDYTMDTSIENLGYTSTTAIIKNVNCIVGNIGCITRTLRGIGTIEFDNCNFYANKFERMFNGGSNGVKILINNSKLAAVSNSVDYYYGSLNIENSYINTSVRTFGEIHINNSTVKQVRLAGDGQVCRVNNTVFLDSNYNLYIEPGSKDIICNNIVLQTEISATHRFMYSDSDSIVYVNGFVFAANSFSVAYLISGTTSDKLNIRGLVNTKTNMNAPWAASARPDGVIIGFAIFDKATGKPLWWNGSAWVDATGIEV